MPKLELKRWLLKRLLFGVLPFLIVVCVLVVLAYINRDWLLLRGSGGLLHHFTGFRNTVGSAEFLPDGNGYLIKDIRLRNPNVFRVQPEFATIHSLLIEMDKPPKKDGKIVVKRVALDIDTINVVLWDRGVLNLSYLSGMRQKTNEMLGLETVEDQAPQEDYLFFIRRLELTVGNVTYTDTTGRRTALSVAFPEQRKFVFKDLRGIPEVIRAVCALIVADRPIPSENLPVNTYVAQFLETERGQTIAASNASGQETASEATQANYNPNILGQSEVSQELTQRPQETEITDFTGEGSENLTEDTTNPGETAPADTNTQIP